MSVSDVSSRFLIVAFTIIVLTSSNTFSQDSKSGFWSGWSVNVNAGLSLFYGDIENYEFYKSFENNSEYSFGYGLMVGKKLSPRFALRGQLYYGDLTGTKRSANKWFEGDVFETSLSTTLDLTNLFLGNQFRTVGVYAMLGVGLAQWQTKLMVHPTNELISSNGEKGGSGIQGRTLEAVIPFGLGIDFNINENWKINLEGSLRPVNSDLLDANIGGFKFDFYSYNFIGIAYTFGKKKVESVPMPPRTLAKHEKEILETKSEPEPVEDKIEVVEKPDTFNDVEKKLEEADTKTGLYESPWPGVTFAIQIAASRKPISEKDIANKYNISGEVSETVQGGWHRYTIGSYNKYWKAKEYKNILYTRNGIEDAFVVAFKDGERLTLNQLTNINYSKDGKSNAEEIKRPVFPQTFSIQVLASRNGNITAAAIKEMYEIEDDVFKEFSEGWYRYCIGNYLTYSQAAKVRNKIRLKGFRDAFIVEYLNGRRK